MRTDDVPATGAPGDVRALEAGKEAGARVVIGGGRPADEDLQAGYFVEPTVFDACDDDMAIVRDGLLSQDVAFLQKPFTPDDLLRKVRQVLEVQ